MKRFATTVFLAALLVFPMSASADHIGIYADESGAACNLAVTPTQFVSVYIVHIYTLGATGSAFAVQDLSQELLLAAVPLGGIISVGNINVGIEAGYGQCIFGHAAIFRLDYLITVPTANCQNKLNVVSHPNYPGVSVADCSQPALLKPASAGQFVFGPIECTTCSANPTAETTWGGVKALYR